MQHHTNATLGSIGFPVVTHELGKVHLGCSITSTPTNNITTTHFTFASHRITSHRNIRICHPNPTNW
jgi:hypothetical protein